VGMEKDTKNQRLTKTSFQTFLNYLRSLQVEVEQAFARWLDVSLATIFSKAVILVQTLKFTEILSEALCSYCIFNSTRPF